MKTTQYAYSFNQEEYHGQFDTIAQALADAADHDPDAIDCYIGEVVLFEPGMDYPVSNLIEALSEQAQEDCGEYADDWPSLSDAAAQGLGQLIQDYIAKHSPVSFYTVTKAKHYSLKTGQEWWDSFDFDCVSGMRGIIRMITDKHATLWRQDKARIEFQRRSSSAWSLAS